MLSNGRRCPRAHNAASAAQRLSSLIVVLLVAGSCSAASTEDWAAGDSSSQPSEPTVSLMGVDGDNENLTGDEDPAEILARYDIPTAIGYTPSERYVIDRAWTEVFADCLADFGYDVEKTVERPDPAAVRWELRSLRFDDRQLIETYGYHWLQPDWYDQHHAVSSAGDDEPATPVAADSDEVCKANANEVLYADIESMPQDIENALSSAQSAVYDRLDSWTDEERYHDRWASCMDRAGYPDEAFAAPNRVRQFLDVDVTAREIEYATADYECRGSSGLRAALFEFIAAEVEAWIDSEPDLVAGIRESIDAQVARAETVLAERE